MGAFWSCDPRIRIHAGEPDYFARKLSTCYLMAIGVELAQRPAMPRILVGSLPLRRVVRYSRMELLTETVGQFCVTAIQADRYLAAGARFLYN